MNINKETRKARISKINKSSNYQDNKKRKFKEKHPKASKTIKISIIVLIALMIIGFGVLIGVFFGVFGDELSISEESLVVGYENSTVYDADGNLIATLSSGTKRKSVSLSEMSEYLPKAYVAIEDERFYTHSGVDFKRTIAAIVKYALNGGKSSFGGSTITQQVIKNITNDKEKTALAGVIRKVKEISKAIQVEHYLSKDQILELYLNLIFVGGDDINGVELGSIYYFNKSSKDLSIAECAFLAGINNSPNAYKPFETYEGKENQEELLEKMKNKINNRTKTVLYKMNELGYINEEQYNQAVSDVENGLKFEKGESSSVSTSMSYHTAAALDQILDQIIEENEDMSRDMAEMYLYSSGLKIYTTQKTEVQTRAEEEVVKKAYYSSAKYTIKDKEYTEYSWPTIVIIDNKTGNVVAAASAKGSKDERSAITKRGFLNIPTELKKQTGSSMKPLSVIAPGIELGVLSGATVYDDNPTTFNTVNPVWTPKNYYSGYKGLMNLRTAIEISANIPHAKAIFNVGLDNSIAFCNSVGLNLGNEGYSLSLGGLSEGVSVCQMAGAYSAIANDGVYNSPTFYTKVTNSSGETLYEPERVTNVVLSKETAYITKSILTQPVVGASGTASYCKIDGMSVAAKTGTTNGDYDRWLCGFTPYFTAAVWYGYEYNASVKGLSGNPAGKIWAAVMKDIHKDLPGAEFEKPETVVAKSVCKLSGMLATDACAGNTYTEYFTEDTAPQEYCSGHVVLNICTETGLIANSGCPQEQRAFTDKPEKEKEPMWETTGDAYNVPTETCTVHSVQQVVHTHNYWEVMSEEQPTCSKEGKRVIKCNCGDMKTETLAKKDHTFSAWVVDKNATEAEEGSKSRTCSVCGYKQVEAIAKLVHTHSYGEWIIDKEATEAEEGSKHRKCETCDETETASIPKLVPSTPPAESNEETNEV